MTTKLSLTENGWPLIRESIDDIEGIVVSALNGSISVFIAFHRIRDSIKVLKANMDQNTIIEKPDGPDAA